MPEGEELAPRILIVDDSPVLAELVERLLSSEGMAPVKCAGGREALAILDAGRFDAVVLDIAMPGIDGYEVLRQVRLTTRTAHLPVILLSGKSRPEDVEKGLEMGATYYVTKPFNESDLVRKLRACIQGRTTLPPRDRE
jgi:DNA-binding response OmpR family regulator